MAGEQKDKKMDPCTGPVLDVGQMLYTVWANLNLEYEDEQCNICTITVHWTGYPT